MLPALSCTRRANGRVQGQRVRVVDDDSGTGKDDRRPRRNTLAEAYRVLDLGLRMTLSVAAFAAGGFFLDRKLELGFPVGTLVGFALGFVAGFWALMRGLDRPRANQDRGDGNGANGSGR